MVITQTQERAVVLRDEAGTIVAVILQPEQSAPTFFATDRMGMDDIAALFKDGRIKTQ